MESFHKLWMTSGGMTPTFRLRHLAFLRWRPAVMNETIWGLVTSSCTYSPLLYILLIVEVSSVQHRPG
jgi:hypothetical protein